MPQKRSPSTAAVAHRTRSRLAAARPPSPPASVAARRLQFEAMSPHCPAAANDQASPHPSSTGDLPPYPSSLAAVSTSPATTVRRDNLEHSSAKPHMKVRLPQYAGKGPLILPSEPLSASESSDTLRYCSLSMKTFICQKKIVISDFTAKTGLIGKLKSCQLFTSVGVMINLGKLLFQQILDARNGANNRKELILPNLIYGILVSQGFTKHDTEDYEAQSLPIKVDPRLLHGTHVDDLGAPEDSHHQTRSSSDGAIVDTIQILEEETLMDG
nr:uncharacterized protein LOC109173926 [Ipomoea batatas]